MKRTKTNYPGVYYIKGKSPATGKDERIYYIRFRKDGKLYEEKAGRQIEDAMTPARASRLRGLKISGKVMANTEKRQIRKEKAEKTANRITIDRLWQKYQANNPHLKGWKTYQSQYNKHLKARFGYQEPKEITQTDVDSFRLSLLEKRTPQTTKHILSLLGRIVNFGVRKQLSERLSFEIEMPNVWNTKTEDLNSKQLKRLLQVIEDDDHPQAGPLMKMALFTGMRRGELFKLKWDDVDFDRGFIHIRDPKNARDQKIPLNDPARELLEGHRKKSEYVFPGRGGLQRVTITTPAKRIRERAGLPKDFRPLHGLRHVYASMLASSGKVDMYTLQKLLTHRDPATTQRYAHLRDEALKRASDLAGDIIADAVKKD